MIRRVRFGLVLSGGVLIATGALFQNCTQMAPMLNASSSADCEQNPSAAVCQTVRAASCVFNGQTLANSASITAYLTSTVPSGASCVTQVRTCHNGALSGTYAYASCAPAAVASCLFDGVTVPDGQNVTAFLAASGNCTSEHRACVKGVLGGSYAFASCTPAGPAACLFNGQTVASGASVIAYPASQVAAGGVCASQLRSCQNGVLTGVGEFAGCTVAAPASCLFNGQTIASGQSVTAFASSSVPAGQTCQPVTRTCANGGLSGTAAFASCTPSAPAACLVNGQTIANGASITLYVNGIAPPGATCATETRVCANGTLSGSATAVTCATSASTAFGPFQLNPNANITTGNLTLVFQADGNLVVYRSTAAGAKALWDTQTGNRSCAAGCSAAFQSDGNLVLYQNGQPYWDSHTSGGAANQLVLSARPPYVSVRDGAGQTRWGGGSGLNFLTHMHNPEGGFSWGGGRPGAADWLSLFVAGSPWPNAMSHTNVIKLYTQTVQNLSDDELAGVLGFLKANNMSLAIEYPMLTYAGTNPGCAIEGITGQGLTDAVAQRIQNLGGDLAYVGMDEPLDALMTLNAGRTDCGLNSIDQITTSIAQNHALFRKYFPAVQVYDIESHLTAADVAGFFDAYRAKAGVPFAAFHDDSEPEQAYWQTTRPALQAALQSRGVPYGFIVNGTCDPNLAPNGTTWNGLALARLGWLRQMGMSTPDQYQVQSWCPTTTRVLSESDPGALTFLMNAIFPPATPAGFDGATAVIYRSRAPAGDYLYSTSSTEGAGAFTPEGGAFSLFTRSTASRARIYRCVAAGSHFLSADPNCEGYAVDGPVGFAEAQLTGGASTPLYRCFQGNVHLVTTQPVECLRNNLFIEGPIGYVP